MDIEVINDRKKYTLLFNKNYLICYCIYISCLNYTKKYIIFY